MEQQGWVKSYREWLDNPYICKDGDHMAVWMYLMLNATHKEKQVNFGKQVITLKVGQLLTSQREIAEKLKINRGKVDRIFALFKSVALIVARTNMQQSIVTIELWDASQNESVARNVAGVWHECGTEQETENEKEKRSKREKDKEKEKNKNEKNERRSIYSRQQSADSCQQRDEFSFPSEKDLDGWLEEDDGIDDWDKMQLYYRQLHSDQWSVVSDQQLDCDIDTNNASSFALTNPIQQEKEERSNPQPPIPLLPCEANHTEGVHGITREACMESMQGMACNQPPRLYDCEANRCPQIGHAPVPRIFGEANYGDTPPSPVTDMFEEFWQAYPKKVGKGYAQECFKRIKPTRKLLDTMLEAIAKQKKSDMWKRDKGQYIPNPSTWLNQKRWEDDLDGETEEKPRLRLGTYL